MNCATCDQPLPATMASLGLLSHPACSVPDVEKDTVGAAVIDGNPFDLHDEKVGGVPLPVVAEDLRAEFMTMIRWHEEFTPRATQEHLGPSDLGSECDRRLAYKITGIRRNNTGDPWPSFVGSSIHTRVEDVVRKYGAEYGNPWLIEHPVIVDDMVRGHADLVRPPVVADIKSAGKDMMDKVRKQGPPLSYLRQINLYARGLEDAGYKIETVAFIFVPRSGWLKDTYVWAAAYDPQIAEEALQRPYKLAETLQSLDILNHPERWQQIAANPGYLCTWCPMYEQHRPGAEGADDKGCPGSNR